MNFRNSKHQAIFRAMTRGRDQSDKALMATLYLLTADLKLWQQSKEYVKSRPLQLNRIHLKSAPEESYTLLCCAKDLLYGTQYLSVRDLADGDLISAKLFKVLCTALSIRRYGLEPLQRISP